MRWRRRVSVVVRLLLLGMVVNIAVALGIAALTNGQGAAPKPRPPGLVAPNAMNRPIVVSPPLIAPGTPSWRVPQREQTTTGPGWRATSRPGGGGAYRFETFSAGWPMLSLQSRGVVAAARGAQATTRWPGWLGGPRWSVFEGAGGRVPIWPTMPGFAMNTAFYGAMLGAPLLLVPVRRWRRMRRGRCARCNYDLTGIDGPCPECGEARVVRSGDGIP